MLIYVNLITILTEYRRTYAKLKLLYEHFGQFQYSDQRDKGQIQTYVDEDGYYVKTKSKIKEYDSSLFRSIAVHILGEIEEKEYSTVVRKKNEPLRKKFELIAKIMNPNAKKNELDAKKKWASTQIKKHLLVKKN